MKPSPKLKSLLDQMPGPDNRGIIADIDKDKMEKTIAELHQQGREGVLGLIEMLVEPGAGDDIKPHHALHCLAVYVTRLDEAARSEFARTVASQLGGGRPKGVQAYLIQELQVAGGPEVAAALGKALLHEALCEPAARALVSIGAGAAEQLRAALPKVKGRCRLAIIQNLGAVHDAASVDALKAATGAEDREVRLAAVWGLVRIADPGCVDAVLKAADTQGYERIQATDACLRLADNLAAAGKKAEAGKIYRHLEKTRTDPSERHVREAARRALAAV